MKEQLIAWRREDEFNLAKAEFDLTPWWFHGKPTKALWSSTFENGISDWIKNRIWNKCEVGNRFYLIRPKRDVKVFEVLSKEDEAKVPLDENGHIDYQSLANQGYDGLRTTSFTFFGPFDGWDCESTVWFNKDWIESVEEVFPQEAIEAEKERAEAYYRKLEAEFAEEGDDESESA